MFKGETVDGVWQHLEVKLQPLWIQYMAQPGGLGKGSPPPVGWRTGVEYFDPPWAPKLDLWEPGLILVNQIPALRSVSESCSAQDKLSMAAFARPATLYDPSPHHSLGDINIRACSITQAGPGKDIPWPYELSFEMFEKFEAGDLVYDPDLLDLVLEAGTPDGWCSVGSTPPGIPRAHCVEANDRDIKAFSTEGCHQGCGRQGDLRFFTHETDYEPLFKCPFCSISRPFKKIQIHIDECVEGKNRDWSRTKFQEVRNIPPLKSDRCGHILCRFCANVSAITSPPFGICLICGRRVSVIKYSKRWTSEPTRTRQGQKISEVFISGNILAHHRLVTPSEGCII